MRSGSFCAFSPRGTSAASSSVSSGPSYHGVRVERVATLSPSRAETGTIAPAVTPTASSAVRAASPTAATRSAPMPASILFTATITCGMLSSPQVIVAVNKIDAGIGAERVAAVGEAARTALEAVGVTAGAIVPVSARDGDNVATRSTRTPWYDGPLLTELLAALVPRGENAQNEPLRIWVQDVYRRGEERIAAGTVRSGSF